MLFEKLLTTGVTTKTKQLYAWGDNNSGELGDNTEVNKSSPVAIGNQSWLNVAAGQSFTLAVKSDRTLWSWGNNQWGQLGNGTVTQSFLLPNSFPSGLSWRTIATSTSHSVGIKSDGSLWAWGDNTYGELGNLSSISTNSPILVSGPTGVSWSAVSSNTGYETNFALTTTGLLYAWGYNLGGQLGVNSFNNYMSSPVLVSGPPVTKTWKTVSIMQGINIAYVAMGIQTDGTLWAWGIQTSSGELGISTNSTVEIRSPVLVSGPAGVSWTTVSTGGNHSLAITTTGILYAWGDNAYGQLGILSSGASASSPVLVSAIAGVSWVSVAAGGLYSLAISTTGILYAWGNNQFGQMGITTIIGNISSPVLVSAPSGVSFSTISAGAYHSLAITTLGALYAWGVNTSGQVGIGTTATVSSPVLVSAVLPTGTPSWKLAALGTAHGVGIQTDGSLWAWGSNSSGQLGANNLTNKSSPVKIGSSSWTFVSAGIDYSMGITTAGALYAWGGNTFGGLGTGDTTTYSSPVAVTGSLTQYSWAAFAQGASYGMAIRNDGSLWGWGSNASGQIGTNTSGNIYSWPVQVTTVTASWTAIASGDSHVLGITTTGLLYGWGLNTSGQVGIGSLTNASSPVLVSGPAGTSWSKVSAGASFSLGITTTGVLYSWGNNATGGLGIASLTTVSSPVLVSAPAGTSFNAISGGNGHALGITTLGALYTWGFGTSGQLGDSSIVTKSSPVKIGSSSWTTVSAGASHSLGITSTGVLWGWGLNTSGQVGINSLLSVSVPTLVSGPAGTSWTAIAGGQAHSLATTTLGRLYGWGLNTSGQVGINSVTTTAAPVLVSGPTGTSWTILTASKTGAFSGAINSTGLLFAWGAAGSYQLGNGFSAQPVSVPSAVYISAPSTVSWSAVSTGASFSLALTTTGQLYAWGINFDGRLGIGSLAYSVPAPVPVNLPAGVASWSQISAGNSHSLAITTTGVLYGWGLNTSGQVGIASLVTVSSPVLVSGPAGTSWSAVSGGGTHSLGITSTGNLYGWGLNTSGQVGIASLVTVSSPVLVTGPAAGTSWISVSAGSLHSTGITTANRLAAWGLATSGQLGDSTIIGSKTSPVLIGSNTWSSGITGPGANTTLGLSTANGPLYGWGLNTSGQAGINSLTNQSSPVLVTAPIYSQSFTAVSAGWSHNLGVTSQGKLFAWGLGTSGQIGIGSLTSQSTPVLVTSPVVSWTAVAAGQYHSMATTTTGILYAWGDNASGEVGNTTGVTVSSPVLVSTPVGTSWTALAAGGLRSAAISSNSQLYVWGLDAGLGVPRNAGAGSVLSPILVYTLGPSLSWTAISAGFTHTLAISTTGVLYAWGEGGSGQLGNNSLLGTAYPGPVSGPAGTSWNAVAAGQGYSLAITTGGILYAWGDNTNYTLGTLTTTAVSSPVLVSSPAGLSWSVVSAGVWTSFAITTRGILYSWGFSHLGELGQLGTTSASSPALVSGPASTSWASVSANSNSWNTYAITSTGILYAWGDNSFGQLGINTLATLSVSSPVLVSGPAGASWSVVSQGSNYGLAIATTGVLYGWGLNSSGNAGLWGVMSPVQVGLSSWNAIAAGDSHALGITSAGTLYAWGYNILGQLGDSTQNNNSSPVLVAQPHSAVWNKVSAGGGHMLAIKSDGSLWAWGLNTSGQLGNNSTTSSSSPVQITYPSGASWSVVAAGSAHSIGLTTVGALYGWGLNTSGQAGVGSLVNKSSPVLVTGPAAGTSWKAVAAGQLHSVGITTAGKLYAWGSNGGVGSLGDNTAVNKSSPVAVTTSLSFTIVSSQNTSQTNYAITTLGVLQAWGLNASGQVGDNTGVNKSSPVLVAGFAGASWNAVSGGGTHGLAITTTGLLYAWGLNSSGQLGTNNLTGKSSPVLVSGPVGTSWSIVAGGLAHSLAVTTTGVLYGWGLDTSGQLGNNAATTVSSPVVIAGPTGRSWTTISISSTWSAGITQEGSLWAWGDGTDGRTGQGAAVSISTPGLVNGPYTAPATNVSWAAVAAGGQYSLAITTAGILYGWGNNGYNQTGTSTGNYIQTYPLPATGPVGGSWTSVAAGFEHSLGITTTGVLYAWGYNADGQIGTLSTITNTSSPVLVSGPAATSYNAIAAGGFHSLAITTGGILYSWGNNSSGQLGDNTTIYKSSPVLVSGNLSWTAVVAGYLHSLAITTTGNLYVWGDTLYNQLGLGGAIVPVQTSGPTTWGNIALGPMATHILGITR